MLLFCKKNNAEVSTYSVLTPTFIIEPKKAWLLNSLAFFMSIFPTASV